MRLTKSRLHLIVMPRLVSLYHFLGLANTSVCTFERIRHRRKPIRENSEIDGETLTNLISKAVSDLNHDGYGVVQIMLIMSGKYDSNSEVEKYQSEIQGSYAFGYGYGYSYTEGVTIVGEKTS